MIDPDIVRDRFDVEPLRDAVMAEAPDPIESVEITVLTSFAEELEAASPAVDPVVVMHRREPVGPSILAIVAARPADRRDHGCGPVNPDLLVTGPAPALAAPHSHFSRREDSMSRDLLTVARAEALFTSWLTTGTRPAPPLVEEMIREAVRRNGGTRGCAAEMAAAYGDHPETAASRMRWALDVIRCCYGTHRPTCPNRPPGGP